MNKYSGIDLHSNNCVVAVIDDTDRSGLGARSCLLAYTVFRVVVAEAKGKT